MFSAQLRLDALADLRELDHRHPDRVAGHVAERVPALDEPLRDRPVDVVRARTRPQRLLRRLVVLLVGVAHLSRPRGSSRRSRARPRPSGRRARRPRATGCRSRPSTVSLRAIANSGPDEHHVHRQPPAPRLDEEPLGRRQRLRGGPPGSVRLEEGPEALGVDADALAHRLELLVALHRSGEVELDVPGHELGAALERAVVADGHHVVEAVDADPLAPRAGRRATRRGGRRRPGRRSTSCRARRRSAPPWGRRSRGRPRRAAPRRRSGGRFRSPTGTSRRPRTRCTRCRRRSPRRARHARAPRARSGSAARRPPCSLPP